MENNNRNKVRALALLSGMLVVALIAFGILQSFSSRTVQQFAVPGSFSSVGSFGTDSLVFSNGNALESYDYTSGQVAALSQNVGLKNIDTISTNGNNVVFHDEQVAQNGSLAAYLKRSGLNPSADYWWVFNSQNKSFRPLQQGTLLAKIHNGDVYALTYGSSGEAIVTMQLPGFQKIKTTSITGSSDFFATTNGFLLQSSDNKIFSTKDGVVNKTILDGAILVGVSADGRSAVTVTNSGDSRDLTLLDLQTNGTSVIASDIANLPVWFDGGNVLYTNNSGQIFSYDVAAQKTTGWKLGGNLANAGSNIKLVAIVGPAAAVVNDGSGNYFLIGKNLATPVTIQ